MTSTSGRRALLFRLALALFAVGGAVFLSPALVPNSFASTGDVTCTATCKNGSCTGNKPYCVCSCSFWGGSAVCSCTSTSQEDNVPAPGT